MLCAALEPSRALARALIQRSIVSRHNAGLKWQADPAHPLYGQRGAYTPAFRKRHWALHLTGNMPDGSRRNLTVPTHVPWTGGVMGVATTYPAVTWTTDLEGLMTSSSGERIVPWRAWESRQQNLARGVRPEYMPS